MSLNIADIANENADLSLKWRMIHAGFTAGLPTKLKGLPFTPYLSFGYLNFKAGVRVKVDDKFLDTLENLGIDPSKLPREKGVVVNNVAGTLGARLDISRHHALEATGAFFFTQKTQVYWATISYTIRWNYPW